MTGEMRIELYGPGMTAMHRAGLGGLAATLLALERRGRAVDGLEWTVEATRVTLRYREPAALVRLVEAGMGCESGLITFAAFAGLPPYDSGDARLHMNEGLLDTLLQHNKMLRPPGAKKEQRVMEVDGEQRFFNVKALEDFVHRYGAAELLDKDGALAAAVELKGWAMPGAVKRHESAKECIFMEPPERYLALLFGVVGVIIIRLVSPRRGKKYKSAVLMPEVDDLRDYARARRRLVMSSRRLTASGLGDAVLIFYAELEAAKLLTELKVRGCHAVAMGTVDWSSNQKTRTRVLDATPPGDRVLRCLAAIERHFPVRRVGGKRGTTYPVASLWRQLFTDNLVRGQQLWAGLGGWLADKDDRKKMMRYERKQVIAMIKETMDSGVLGEAAEIRFVEACHEALRRRYGRLGERIRDEGLEASSVFERENERIRASLSRCKNAATLRSAIVMLWAEGGQNGVLREHWRDVLNFLTTEHWELARDLALLALVSYPGSGAEPTQTTEDNP